MEGKQIARSFFIYEKQSPVLSSTFPQKKKKVLSSTQIKVVHGKPGPEAQAVKVID